MNKILLLTAMTATAFMATPASAAAPAGGRVEAILGYDYLSFADENDGGAVYGIGAGFDFVVGSSASIGLDAEATDSTQKIDIEDVTEKAGRDLYAGIRASFPVSDKTNLYVKGGYTNARFTASDGEDSDSTNLDGLRFGVGAQSALNGKFYAAVEYRYSNYEAGVSRHQGVFSLGTRF